MLTVSYRPLKTADKRLWGYEIFFATPSRMVGCEVGDVKNIYFFECDLSFFLNTQRLRNLCFRRVIVQSKYVQTATTLLSKCPLLKGVKFDKKKYVKVKKTLEGDVILQITRNVAATNGYSITLKKGYYVVSQVDELKKRKLSFKGKIDVS